MKPVIYADTLFLFNFLMNTLILIITAKFLHTEIGCLRIGAAAALGAVYSVLMMQNNFVAPNINLENPDECAEGLNLAAKRVDTEVGTVLSNSFGFGGTNSALVIKK